LVKKKSRGLPHEAVLERVFLSQLAGWKEEKRRQDYRIFKIYKMHPVNPENPVILPKDLTRASCPCRLHRLLTEEPWAQHAPASAEPALDVRVFVAAAVEHEQVLPQVEALVARS
jgi:hypothetical protein